MCAVQDVRDAGLASGGDLPFEFAEKMLAECSAYQPVVDFIGGEPLLYARLGDAVKLASERNVLGVVTTNGLKLRDKARGTGTRQPPSSRSRWMVGMIHRKLRAVMFTRIV